MSKTTNDDPPNSPSYRGDSGAPPRSRKSGLRRPHDHRTETKFTFWLGKTGWKATHWIDRPTAPREKEALEDCLMDSLDKAVDWIPEETDEILVGWTETSAMLSRTNDGWEVSWVRGVGEWLDLETGEWKDE